MATKFEVVQSTVVVLSFEGGMSAVVAIATTPEAAKDIAEALTQKALERAING